MSKFVVPYFFGGIVGELIVLPVTDQWLDLKRRNPNSRVWRDFASSIFVSSIFVSVVAWPVAIPVALVVYNKMNKD